MSDTDSTYSMNPRAARPTALGDLRFAGTVAAGLVAGTLGLGALAAPLVGWKDWPSALTQQATSQPVVLAKAAEPKARNEQTPRKGRPGPRSESVLDNIGLPGAGGGAAAPGGLATLINDPSATGPSTRPESDRSAPEVGRSTTTTGGDTGSAEFSPATIFQKTDKDDNQNGAPDSVEPTLGKTNASTQVTTGESSGLSAATEFRIRSTPGMWADTNADGFIDGNDDADADGVSNAQEDLNGSDPTKADSDDDGNPDGMDDRNGDGYPDGLPVPATPPVTETPDEEPPVTVAPPETDPVDDGTDAPPAQDPPPATVEEPTTTPVETPTTETPAPTTEAPAPTTDAPDTGDTQPETSAPTDDAPAAATEAAESDEPNADEAPKEKAPKEEAPKEKAPKEKAPKEQAPAPKEDAPAPKKEAPAAAPKAEAPEAPAPPAEAPAPAPEAPAPAPEPPAPAPVAAPAEPAPAPAQEAAPAPAEQADPAATPAW